MKRNIFFYTTGLALLLLTSCSAQQSQVSYIGIDTAKQAALNAASLSTREVSALTAEMSTRDGLDYYQVSFASEGQSYQYEVDALTGIVINTQAANASPSSAPAEASQTPTDSLVTDADTFDQTPIIPSGVVTITPSATPAATPSATPVPTPAATPVPTPVPTPVATPVPTPIVDAYTSATPNGSSKSSSKSGTKTNPQAGAQTGNYIGEAEAKRIALEHAGLSENQVTLVHAQLEWDHGRWEYDVEFYSADYTEYDYEIDASSGAILSYDYDAEYYSSQQTGTGTGTNTISAEDAKQLALNQVPGATINDIRKFKTDYDDGRLQYEGKIIYNGMEYEFEIDAYSGSIRDWSAEPMYR